MSLETRREVINYLVIFSEAEQQEMLRKAQEIFQRRDGSGKYVQDVRECR